MLKHVLLFPFAVYRSAISPLLGTNCRFEPSCSCYAKQALSQYGIAKGSWLSTKRLLRCNPWGGNGFDPVPTETDTHVKRS